MKDNPSTPASYSRRVVLSSGVASAVGAGLAATGVGSTSAAQAAEPTADRPTNKNQAARLRPVHSFNTVVYKAEDNWYVCEDRNGSVLAESDTTPETVIQTALDRAGDIKIFAGDYYCSPGLAAQNGLRFKSNTTLYSDYETYIWVPNGYTGGCLVIDPAYNGNTIRNVTMVGGISLREDFRDATVQVLWDGFRFHGSNSRGVSFSEFGFAHVYNAHAAIALDFISASSYVTSNAFKNVKAYYTDILMDIRNPTNAPQLGFSTNEMSHIDIQSFLNTSHGFKGIIGNNNLFINCAVWDVHNSEVPGGVVSAQFMPGSTNQMVLGGIMMHSNVDDQSAKGQVRWIDGHGPVPQWEFYKFFYSTSGSGDSTFTIPHNMGLKPDNVLVFAKSSDAAISPFVWTSDATNVNVKYSVGTPPPPGENNVAFEVWCSVK